MILKHCAWQITDGYRIVSKARTINVARTKLSFLLWMLVRRDWLTFTAAASTEANENREDVGDAAVLAAVCPRDRDRLWCLASRGLDLFLAKEIRTQKKKIYFCFYGQKIVREIQVLRILLRIFLHICQCIFDTFLEFLNICLQKLVKNKNPKCCRRWIGWIGFWRCSLHFLCSCKYILYLQLNFRQDFRPLKWVLK